MRFDVGDRVRVSIPDPSDPDHMYHGATGEIVDVLKDDLGEVTGDPADNYLYTVELDANIGTIDVRHDDLERP